MKHKFGFKQTFFALMLAAAGLFGASATIVNKQIEETHVVEKADASAHNCIGIYVEDQVNRDFKILFVESYSLSSGYTKSDLIAFFNAEIGSQQDWTTRTAGNASTWPSVKGWSYKGNSGADYNRFVLNPTNGEEFTFRFPSFVTSVSLKVVGNTWRNEFSGEQPSTSTGKNWFIYDSGGWNISSTNWGSSSYDFGNVSVTKHYYSNGSQVGTASVSVEKYSRYTPSAETYSSKYYADWYTNSGMTTQCPLFVTNSAKDVYASTYSGVYLLGNTTFTGTSESWTFKSGKQMSKSDESNYDYVYRNLTLSAGAKLKARNSTNGTYFNLVSGKWERYPADSTYINNDGDANIEIITGATFDIYIRLNNGGANDADYLIVYTGYSGKLSITYKYMFDKVEQTQWGTNTISNISYGTSYSSLNVVSPCDPSASTLAGYVFDGFYHDSSLEQACNRVIRNESTVYARFTRKASNVTYYIEASACSSDINTTVYAHYAVDGVYMTSWPGIKCSSLPGKSNLWAVNVPEDTTEFVINNYTSGNQHQTEDIIIDNEHNLFVIEEKTGTGKWDGEWKDMVFYLEGYFDGSGTASGTSSNPWTSIKMSDPIDDSGNQAEIKGVTIANGISADKCSQIKVKMFYTNQSGDQEYYFGHCQTGYSFIDYSSGKTNTQGSSSSTHDGYSNVFFNSSLTSGHDKYSFYFKNGIIYIEDQYAESDCGYLYFANPATPENITVTATNSEDHVVKSNVRLSSITGERSSLTVKFNNIVGLHKIPLYNLRGNDTSHYIKSLVINDGSSSRTYTWAATTTGNVNIYIDITSSTQDSSVKGPAAALAFDVDTAIKSCDDSSVCNMTQAAARLLKTSYTSLTQSQKDSFLGVGSAINTYTSSLDPEVKSFVSMTSVWTQIISIADNGKPLGRTITTFNPFNLFADGSNNYATIIIIIASSISLLSITALSVLVIKKRKEKQE